MILGRIAGTVVATRKDEKLDLQNAVRDDPENTTAKFDLELLLRVLTAQGVRVGSNNQAGAGSTGRHGAGGGIPGSGY